MWRIRTSWKIVALVVLLMLTVPPLREQVRLLILTRGNCLFPTIAGGYTRYDDPAWVQALRERAPVLVARQFPHDAELWMAAGIIAPDYTTRLKLLRRATEQPEVPPVVWARYFEALAEALPEYRRIGTEGPDPDDPKAVSATQEALRNQEEPDRLDPKEAAPALAALAAWAKADPRNALPVALQTPVLYGLHRDREALARWIEAGARPEARDYDRETSLAVARLLVLAGLPRADATAQTTLLEGVTGRTNTLARLGAHIACYEGRVARREGRSVEALHLWGSTMLLGRRLQEASTTLIGCLAGGAIEAIGASPTWKWYADEDTGTRGGPISRARFWYGPQHAFYVSQVGAAKDAALRDRLVLAKARNLLLRGHLAGDGALSASMGSGMQFQVLTMEAWVMGGLALAHLLTLLVASLWPGRKDEASTLRPGWDMLLAADAFIPQLFFGFIVYRAMAGLFREGGKVFDTVTISLGAAVLGLLLLLHIAHYRHHVRLPRAEHKKAWRGNVLRLSRAGLAVGALLYLGLSVAAAWQRHVWVQEWGRPEATELAWIKRDLGAKWDRPEIPKDAWRAEYPKLKER
jgi:hypothetical protein